MTHCVISILFLPDGYDKFAFILLGAPYIRQSFTSYGADIMFDACVRLSRLAMTVLSVFILLRASCIT